MNIFITGGCGYVGTVLVNYLLNKNHSLTVLDVQWFGNYLKPHPKLKIIKGDIKDIESISLEGIDSFIHLANISNDPGVDLDPNFSWEVNVLSSHKIIDHVVRQNVKQFIFASSGSVYGIKDEADVTENLKLVPISTYNKTKMVAERVFLSYKDLIQIHCIRPATVCGFSPRMRLDISVNLLTMQALTKNKIKVLGGQQTRPNININDMIRVYDHFLNNPSLESGNYNAGFENLSILQVANIIKDKIPSDIEIHKSNDPRSYRQNSDKIIKTGFYPQFTVEDAINEIISKYSNNKLKDLDSYYNIKTMKKLFKNEITK
tara:strand:- start:122 stop:1075 length:954 start_codon:yes stop_codon:yes gene_type:complete